MQSMATALVDLFAVTSCCALARIVLNMALPAVQGCMLRTGKSTFNVCVKHVPSTDLHIPSFFAAASVQDVVLHCRHTDYILATDLFSASLA